MINFTKYFSWGDTIGKNKNGSGSYSFSEANYNAGVCGSGHNLSGDIPQGNATYDAARANMGSPWKIPTYMQSYEMMSGTNSTWTTINGVNGTKFTSKTDSSKYIFFPAGGHYNNTTHNFVAVVGYYLLTLYDSSQVIYVQFSSHGAGISGNTSRYIGLSVRAIQ